MKILFTAAEVSPFVKTGGLADVAGSLPAAMARLGFDVTVMVPLYEQIGAEWRKQMTFLRWDMLTLAWRKVYCGIFSLRRDGVTFWFVDNEAYFKRKSVYGYHDDGERFAFFSRAILEMPPKLGWIPDLIHCNDWHTALVPVYLLEAKNAPMGQVKSVYTIHNIAYQGSFPAAFLEDVCGLPRSDRNVRMLMHQGQVNLMQGGIYACHALTTVSPTYACQLEDDRYAHGLGAAVRGNRCKLRGIRNGIDTREYDPARDPGLAERYTPEHPEGKAVCKAYLQRVSGLREDPRIPVLACVSRLVEEKGFDLILSALKEIMKQNVQLVILGTGDWSYEEAFRLAARQYAGKLSVSILYSQALATAVYGGADIFLMPSASEPCGLSQMIAMRYGTVPVVRSTGGLRDTVPPWDWETETGLGFSFDTGSREAFLDALHRALTLYRTQPAAWGGLRHNDMTADFSWDVSCRAYAQVYRETAQPGQEAVR